MLRGGSSLANNLTYGLSDSVGKFTGTLGKGLAELSMERDATGRASARRARFTALPPFLCRTETISTGGRRRRRRRDRPISPEIAQDHPRIPGPRQGTGFTEGLEWLASCVK